MLDESPMGPHDSVMSPHPVEDVDEGATALSGENVAGTSLKNTPQDELPSSSSADKKRKKKKKKAKNSATASEAASDDSVSDVVAEMTDPDTDADTIESWRAKAKQRLSLLQDLNEHSRRIKEELHVAHQRATDAEEAESLVNEGLKTATSLLAERDRQVSDLTSTNANLRAELNTVTEEKKKVDKRLALVKTIGSNLQEAKEAASASERKLEEAMVANSRLRTSLATAQSELAELRPLRKVVARKDDELQKLRAERQSEEKESVPTVHDTRNEISEQLEGSHHAEQTPGNKQNNVVLAGVGVGGVVVGVALTVVLRAIGSSGSGVRNNEDTP